MTKTKEPEYYGFEFECAMCATGYVVGWDELTQRGTSWPDEESPRRWGKSRCPNCGYSNGSTTRAKRQTGMKNEQITNAD